MSDIKFGFTAQQIIDEGRVVQEDIDDIRTWLATQDLPKLTDEQVVVFLLSCYNDKEATKRTIEAHFAVKDSCPKIHDNWNLEREDIQKQLRTCELCIMPERRSDGCAVIINRLKDTYYRNVDMAQGCSIVCMTLEAVVHDNPPTGLVLVIDYSGVGLMHMTRLRFELLKPSFKFLQEGLPVALKEVHILNTVYFMDKLMSIMKPFISKKVMDMIHFHQSDLDMEEFYEKHVPKNCLPADYGGDLPPVEVLHQRNIEKLTQMQPYFDATAEQRRSIKY